MYEFGDASRTKLETCHEDLQLIMNEAIRRSQVDFGISEGYRTVERQYQLYQMGRSKIDGVSRKGKHNYYPSMAVDIFTYHEDAATRAKLAYDKVHLAYIGGVVTSTAQELFQQRKIRHLIRWGANWNMDGVIDYDQAFDDYPHFELYEP